MSKIVSVEEILNDLENGLTRKPSSIGYDPLIGSISEKYGFDNNELNLLFNHPKLKGKKTKKPASLLIVDTIEEKEAVLNNAKEEVTEVQVSEIVNNTENVVEELNEEIAEIKEISLTLEPSSEENTTVVAENNVEENNVEENSQEEEILF